MRARHRVGPHGLGEIACPLVDHRQAVVVRVGDEQGVAVLVQRGRLKPDRDLLDFALVTRREVDLRDRAGDRAASTPARHDRRTVRQVREVVPVGRTPALVGYVRDLAAVGEHHLTRSVSDRDLTDEGVAGSVDHAELVGAVERHIELRPVRGERHPGRQLGAVGDVGRLCAVLAELAGVVVAAAISGGRGVGPGRREAGAAPTQEDRRAFWGGCSGVVVEAELQEKLRLWNPQGRAAGSGVWGEQRPVGRDCRVVAVVCVERGLLHHRPGLQVEDREESLEVVPAQGRQIPSVRADRARHEPLGAVEEARPCRRDPLVGREQDAVGGVLRNLLSAERVEPADGRRSDTHDGYARCQCRSDRNSTPPAPTHPLRHELSHGVFLPTTVWAAARIRAVALRPERPRHPTAPGARVVNDLYFWCGGPVSA